MMKNLSFSLWFLQAFLQMCHGTFSYTNCGDPKTDLADLKQLVVTPDPLVLPGPITFTFDVDLKQTVNSPLKCDLRLEEKRGVLWRTYPCINGVGSCTYSDVCPLLEQVTCPQDLVDAKIPCNCPFPQGSYSLTTSYDISTSAPPGKYRVKIVLSTGKSQVACTQVAITLR